jgi:hypothetical protein
MPQANLGTFHPVAFFGFYLPPLLWWVGEAIFAFIIVRWLLGQSSLYRFIWHRSLFNLALYVLLLGGIVFVGNLVWQ